MNSNSHICTSSIMSFNDDTLTEVGISNVTSVERDNVDDPDYNEHDGDDESEVNEDGDKRGEKSKKKGGKKKKKSKSKKKTNNPEEEEDVEEDVEEEEEDENRPKKKQKQKNPEYDREWETDNSGRVGEKVADWIPTPNKCDDDELKQLKSPYGFYRLFMPDDYLEEVVTQSRIYAEQIGKGQYSHLVTKDTLLCTQGVMLMSGYAKVPRCRMYWLDAEDVYNPLVSNNIRRDTFDHVLEVLHFVDNNTLDPDDRFAKVRPNDDVIQCHSMMIL